MPPPKPACGHHYAQKHANLGFPSVKLIFPGWGIARLSPLFSGNGCLSESFVCGTTSLGPPDPSCVLKKKTGNPWMGSSLALRVPSHEDKWFPRPVCSHQCVQKHAKLSFPLVKLTIPEWDIARFCFWRLFLWKRGSE